MNIRCEAIKLKDFIQHETKKGLLRRYALVLVILFIYIGYISIEYGFRDGVLVGFLTWSLFVFGTPIADAGVLLDLPIRLLTKIRMLYAEMAVWVIALGMNIFVLKINPGIYQTNELTRILKYILTHPWPGYFLISLCFIGTFITIMLGDELLDIKEHKEKTIFKKYPKTIIYTMSFVIFGMVLAGYIYIEHSLGIKII
jgi:hypothetical protein